MTVRGALLLLYQPPNAQQCDAYHVKICCSNSAVGPVSRPQKFCSHQLPSECCRIALLCYSHQSMIAQQLNAQTGELEWVVVDPDGEITRAWAAPSD